MLKAKLAGKGADDTYVLGITAENVQGLKLGLPIRVRLQELMGPPIEVVIFYGETLNDCTKALTAACKVGPETKVSVDMRGQKGETDDVV